MIATRSNSATPTAPSDHAREHQWRRVEAGQLLQELLRR